MNAVMTDTPPTLVIIEVNGFLDGGDSCASPSEPVPRYEVVLLPKLEP